MKTQIYFAESELSKYDKTYGDTHQRSYKQCTGGRPLSEKHTYSRAHKHAQAYDSRQKTKYFNVNLIVYMHFKL